jgi:arylsulfatase A-like enzyme
MGNSQNNNSPNIVFIIADDQRFDTIGGINNSDIITPNLHYLARNGTVFHNAYLMGSCHPAVCMASRAMLLTGTTLFHLEKSGEIIPRSKTMLGEQLQHNGYSTFGVGKWHNGEVSFNRCFKDGESIFFGGMDDHWDIPVCDYVQSGKYPEEVEVSADAGYGEYTLQKRKFHRRSNGIHATDLFSGSAASYIKQYDESNPFLLYVAFTSPHYPRTTKQKFHALYDWEKIKLNKNVRSQHEFDTGAMTVPDEHIESYPVSEDTWRRHLCDYYAMISHMDEEVGSIIDALKSKGLYDNTLIIYTADHGLSVGGHGLMGKHNLYDHSVHVPFILHGPNIPVNEKRNTFVYLSDVFPTLCEYLQIPIPDSVEGNSFLPAVYDAGYDHRNELFFAYQGEQRSVCDGTYKLIEYLVQNSRKTQLFDVVGDADEVHDLSSDTSYSSVISELRNHMLKWMRSLDDNELNLWENHLT